MTTHIFYRTLRQTLPLAVALAGAVTAFAADNAKLYVGRWALTIPGGGAGWLGIEEKDDGLKGSILWGGGSVVPVNAVKVEGDTLLVTRINESRKRDASGKQVVTREVETIRALADGDTLSLTTEREKDGKVSNKVGFTGKRIPPLPAAPDLAKVKFGDPIKLFNGQDLTGWKVMGGPSGWSAKDGIMVNDAPQEPGKHKSYANLRTEKEFEDCNLTLEFRVPQGGNSGVYLRGIYEVQVADSFGKKNDSHNCAGLYSRITPTENACKPAGEWQTYDITLVDRHLTVILNGKKVIDNQPVLGCTGGALWADEFRPGPLYLQGDHTSVDYRNLVIRPVVK
ncbi:MAG: DUF1080 domain-containing protein [Verrucomicrobia bacterium]|nr:DUF1080 domain-containing protein [Verrucomicrobiota bacterium]